MDVSVLFSREIHGCLNSYLGECFYSGPIVMSQAIPQ